jgi:hypothetical protein
MYGGQQHGCFGNMTGVESHARVRHFHGKRCALAMRLSDCGVVGTTGIAARYSSLDARSRADLHCINIMNSQGCMVDMKCDVGFWQSLTGPMFDAMQAVDA